MGRLLETCLVEIVWLEEAPFQADVARPTLGPDVILLAWPFENETVADELATNLKGSNKETRLAA